MKVDDNTLQEITEQVVNMENVDSANIKIKNKVITIEVNYDSNTTIKEEQATGLKILNLFDKDIIDLYDFQFDFNNCSGIRNNSGDINWYGCSNL